MKKELLSVTSESQFAKTFEQLKFFKLNRIAFAVEVATEIFEKFLKAVQEFFRKHHISFEIIDPSGTRLAIYTASGAALGGALGYKVDGFLGAIIGAILGGALFSTVSYLKIRFTEKVESKIHLVESF